jgi:hypothetical protein
MSAVRPVAAPSTSPPHRARFRTVGRGSVAALLVLPVLVAGCAASGPMPKPADFPNHTLASPIEIHWGLSVAPDGVHAEGLAERRSPALASARLQLLGLDATGKTVSFTNTTFVRWSVRDVEPFSLSLRPRGGEQRYEVRVYTFNYQDGLGR